MVYALLGLIAGFILNFFILIPQPGVSIVPRFYSSYDNIEKIEKSAAAESSRGVFPVKNGSNLYLLDAGGGVAARRSVSIGLTSVSGNGEFFVRYMKTGNSVELYGIKGERFWKIRSLEYPYLSYSGKLILLVNGDHSIIRAVNENGQSVLKDGIHGRFCTVVTFADRSDTAAAGFLDGRFHVIGSGRGLVYSGRVPGENIIKGLSVSSTGKYISVYYGNTDNDSIRILKLEDGSYKDIKLDSVRYTKAPIHVTDTGTTTLLGNGSILNISGDGGLVFRILVPPARDSFARISSSGNLYAVSYTMESGGSKVILFGKNGRIIYSREFEGEKYMDNAVRDDTILLKGSQHIYCYTVSGLYPL